MRWTLLGMVTLLGLVVSCPVRAESVATGSAEKVAKPVEAITVGQACCTILKDLKPGLHKITFVHPNTCCPVTVCFCLPCGCYEVKCSCDKIRFKYPGLCNDVVIKFKKCGGVVVKD